MSVTHIVTKELNYSGSSSIRGTDTTTSGSELVLDESIPANQTNLAVAFAFANAKLKSFFAWSDVAMSVFTNEASTGTPQEKINLIAGVPYYWSLTDSFLGETGDSAASPFDGNVTSLFVTNTTAGTLKIRALVDPT